MQKDASDENYVMLLYYVPFQSEAKAKEDIISALKQYVELKPSNIQIKSKDDKYSASITIPANKFKFLQSVSEVQIGETTANLRRYYFDHQLYINKLPVTVTEDEVRKYFSGFGEVVGVAITSYVGQNKTTDSGLHHHCFVKFKSDSSVSKCFLTKKHQIRSLQIKILRTFKIGESQATDKKLYFKVEPTPQNLEVFQNFCNEYFQTFGELRERIKFENFGKGSCKATLTYASSQGSELALKKFDKSVLKKNFNIVTADLKIFTLNKGEQGENKIYVDGIKSTLDEQTVKKTFQSYGQVLDVNLTLNKSNTAFCGIISFAKRSSVNTLLAEYIYNNAISGLFSSKPYINIYINPGDRKLYNKKYKGSRQNPKGQTPSVQQPIFMPPYFPMGQYPPTGFMPNSNNTFGNMQPGMMPPMGAFNPPIQMQQNLQGNNFAQFINRGQK